MRCQYEIRGHDFEIKGHEKPLYEKEVKVKINWTTNI